MQIEVNTTTKTVVDIELPYYSKDVCHYYKVISADKLIAIHDGTGHCGIEERFYASSAFHEDCAPIQAAEFEAAYERISERLKTVAFQLQHLTTEQ